MNFCCIFPSLKNFDYYKAIATVPYLAKNHDYHCTLVCYDNDEFTNFKDIPNLSFIVIPKKFNYLKFLNFFLIIHFLIKNAKNIDVLNGYHYKPYTMILFLIYRIFNWNGIIYHTLDVDYEHCLFLTGNKKGLKHSHNKIILLWLYKYLVDFGSVETKKTYNKFREFNEIYNEKLIYLPIPIEPNPSIVSEKKNQILCVGRIGSQQKASDIILQSFKNVVDDINDGSWILKMVGPISNEFNEYIQTFLNENPHLKDLIIFTGNIEDRDELYKVYSESKIFLLPSRHGSFEIVFVEALYYGNYLLVTDVGVGKYLIDLTNFGKIVEIDDVEGITNYLIDTIKNYDIYLKENNCQFKKLIDKEFGPIQVEKVDMKIKEIKNKTVKM